MLVVFAIVFYIYIAKVYNIYVKSLNSDTQVTVRGMICNNNKSAFIFESA